MISAAVDPGSYSWVLGGGSRLVRRCVGNVVITKEAPIIDLCSEPGGQLGSRLLLQCGLIPTSRVQEGGGDQGFALGSVIRRHRAHDGQVVDGARPVAVEDEKGIGNGGRVGAEVETAD